MNDKKKYIVIAILICLVVILAVVIIFLFLLVNKTKDKIESSTPPVNEIIDSISKKAEINPESNNTENESTVSNKIESEKNNDPSDSETNNSTEESSANTDSNETSNSNSSNTDFNIDENTEENYYSVLDTDDYDYYHSDEIDELGFYYPLHLYNRVYKDTSVSDTAYGQNVEIIDFQGSSDSELKYIATERMDNDDLSDFSSFVYNNEASNIQNMSEIYPLKVDNDKGFFIITGWDPDDDSRVIYNMVKISKDYVYQMLVIFPNFIDEDDKNIKSYYTECLYRTCGFTNSSKDVRSYEEYLSANN